MSKPIPIYTTLHAYEDQGLARSRFDIYARTPLRKIKHLERAESLVVAETQT